MSSNRQTCCCPCELTGGWLQYNLGLSGSTRPRAAIRVSEIVTELPQWDALNEASNGPLGNDCYVPGGGVGGTITSKRVLYNPYPTMENRQCVTITSIDNACNVHVTVCAQNSVGSGLTWDQFGHLWTTEGRSGNCPKTNAPKTATLEYAGNGDFHWHLDCEVPYWTGPAMWDGTRVPADPPLPPGTIYDTCVSNSVVTPRIWMQGQDGFECRQVIQKCSINGTPCDGIDRSALNGLGWRPIVTGQVPTVLRVQACVVVGSYAGASSYSVPSGFDFFGFADFQ